MRKINTRFNKIEEKEKKNKKKPTQPNIYIPVSPVRFLAGNSYKIE